MFNYELLKALYCNIRQSASYVYQRRLSRFTPCSLLQ
jgi:hypothetical protein